MRVAVETQYCVGTPTGLGAYAAGVAQALGRLDGVAVAPFSDPTFDVWRFDRRLWWDQVRGPALARSTGADVFHFTGGTMPWRPPRPVVVTVHDLVWLRGANRGRPYVRWYYGALQPRLVRGADALIADTRAAGVDIAAALRIDEGRVAVCGAGVDDDYFGLARAPSEPPYVLAVGTIEERKDLEAAVRAIARLDGVSLRAAGPHTPYARRVWQTAQRLGVAHRVALEGYVERHALLDLYAHASALIFPSRYEGFGLPPLQALAAGLPVVAADIPVTREVLGDCAAYAPAGDDATMAALLDDALRRTAEVEARVARGRHAAAAFTWAAVACRLLQVYRSVTGTP